MTAERMTTPVSTSAKQSLAPFLAELRPLIALAIPLVAGLTTSTFLGLVDTYMLGPFGESVLGAVSLTSSAMLIFYAGLYGFMGPVGLLVGQAYGANNPDKIANILRHGLIIALAAGLGSAALMLIGLFYLLPHTGQPADVMAVVVPYWVAMGFSLVPYALSLVYKQFYDAIDRPWIGFGLTLIAVISNIILNWLLIGGNLGFPALGILGAGIASLTASAIGVLGMTLHYRWSRAAAPYRDGKVWTLAAFREQLREGVPMSIQYLLEGGSVAVAGVLIGWLGTTALAANQIVFSVTSVLYMLPLGMSGAVSIRVSQAAGGGENGRIRAISYTALSLVVSWAALFTIVLMLGGRQIASIFVDQPEVIAAAAATFVAVGIMQVFDGLQSVSLGALRGVLDNQWPTRISLIGYWLIALPVGYFLGAGLNLGPAGFWGGFGFGLAFAAAMLLRRLRSKMAT